jgi:hypothetical protein
MYTVLLPPGVNQIEANNNTNNNNNNNNNSVDVAITRTRDRNEIQKDAEKILKYEKLTIEVQRMWTLKNMAIPVII